VNEKIYPPILLSSAMDMLPFYILVQATGDGGDAQQCDRWMTTYLPYDDQPAPETGHVQLIRPHQAPFQRCYTMKQ